MAINSIILLCPLLAAFIGSIHMAPAVDAVQFTAAMIDQMCLFFIDKGD
jgi:hypothetical protein